MNAIIRVAALCSILLLAPALRAEEVASKRLLYVVAPGIRNLLEYGGAGILVFDIDKSHAFVRRIETTASREPRPDNIKGVCASAATGRLYFTTPQKLYCFDLATEKTLWDKALPKGCDRPSITPDGKLIYVPSFEKDIWNVVSAEGEGVATIETKNGAHNTVGSLDGTRMYLGGLGAPTLFVADTGTSRIVARIGPFSGSVRPFTVNGAKTHAYVCVNGLLGFEVADLAAEKVIHRVEVAGVKSGPVARHGCPSHGVGLTPEEREVWVCDAFNKSVHVFDATVMPPKQLESIRLRDEPGWVTFSIDGKYAYPSSGEVIDVKSHKIITALKDEKGREVGSEKMLELQFDAAGKLLRTGDQFGIGRKPAAP
jgi:sugar lactone lactonase YvrE